MDEFEQRCEKAIEELRKLKNNIQKMDLLFNHLELMVKLKVFNCR
jgi:hypothetical protein